MVTLWLFLFVMSRFTIAAIGNTKALHFPWRLSSLKRFSKANNIKPLNTFNILFSIQESSISKTSTNLTYEASSSQSKEKDNNGFIDSLIQQYPGKISCIHLSQYPNVDIYLCGTIHVSQTSVNMVQDVIRAVKPSAVMLELCCNRIDSLISFENQENIPPVLLRDVLHSSWKNRSLTTLGAGLLLWMQGKAAKLLGSKVGGEFAVAAKEAHIMGAEIVLGDRLYDVTIQRVFDKLGLGEKIKAAFILVWEVVTLRFHNMKNYVNKSDTDSDFVENEIESFSYYFPGFTDVVIKERDEYLAQSLIELCKILNDDGKSSKVNTVSHRKKVVAIIGAGHLPGIREHLGKGGSSLTRMQEISKSSKHEPTWSATHSVPILHSNFLFVAK